METKRSILKWSETKRNNVKRNENDAEQSETM